MKARIFDRDGEAILYLDAPEDQVAINVPMGGRFERLADDVDLKTLVGPPRPRGDDPEAAP